MKRFLRIFLALVALAGVGLALVARQLYRPYKGFSDSVILEVAPGTQVPDLADNLVQRGVLAGRWPFLLRYFAGRPFRRRVKAGEYLFDRPLRPIDVYQKLVRGDIYLHPVLVPEGSDRFDIAEILQQTLRVNPSEFLRLTQHTSSIRDLDPQAATLEGYLFPDTYRFPRGVSAETVVETMVARFRRLLDAKFKPDVDRSGRTLRDVITLASLVEKETPDPMERPVVAGVFERRLEKGMALACDPTVIYVARLRHHMLEHPLPPIKRSDLEFNSPYNTYLHSGLPPGPIANPGEASIRAALAPAPGDALYFVSNNHGGHIFAATLAEHERNVARYRRQVAELRSLAQGETGAEGGASPAKDPGSHHATDGSKKRGRQKQKTAHPGARAGAGTRASGGA
jgi:UPF0755 protein